MANTVLMTWGPIVWQVMPFNINGYSHHTGSDFARKDVMESNPRREWVGERDEEISLRGRVMPFHIGGFGNLETFENTRRAGQAHQLTRGSGGFMTVLGWYVCEDLRREHSSLAPNGIGKIIDFEARFARVDIPYPPGYFDAIFTAMQKT